MEMWFLKKNSHPNQPVSHSTHGTRHRNRDNMKDDNKKQQEDKRELVREVINQVKNDADFAANRWRQEQGGEGDLSEWKEDFEKRYGRKP